MPLFAPLPRLDTRARRAATLVGTLLLVLLASACSGDGKKTAPSLDGPSSGENSTAISPDKKSWAGDDPAPELPGGLTWFNVATPPTIESLKGKVVLLDFWTLGCINCQHIIPDLKALESEFADELVVIGVHSGKYATEHEDESVREAIGRFGLEHPVVNDPDFAVWELFGASAWPTLVLIDPSGNLVGAHAGEGVYELFQPIVQSLVTEFDANGEVDRTPFVTALDAVTASTVLSYPGKVLADERNRRLFIADSGHNRILQASLDGELQRAFGDGSEGFADGAADEARFNQPQGIALSPDGATLYVADTRNHAIREIDLASGDVTTIGGTGKQIERFPADGTHATKADMASPWDVLIDGDTLYISMAGIHQLWTINLRDGTVAIFAGTSREGINDGNPRTMATLAQPSALTAANGFLYWTDPESSSVRQVAIPGGQEVSTIVGTGLFDYGAEDGPFDNASLQHPQGLAAVGDKLYVGDTYNQKIRVIDLQEEEVSTLAGSGARGWEDGDGDDALFDEPAGLSAANGRLYVADTNNHLVRVVDIASGMTGTLPLTNLGALGTASGRLIKLDLPEQTIAPGAGQLTLKVTSPGGHHLNSQAPSRITFSTSNAAVLEPGEPGIAWSSDEDGITVAIPANYGAGSAVLTANGEIYYCRTGEEALCFIQQVQVTLPVKIAAGGQGEAVVNIDLPPGG